MPLHVEIVYVVESGVLKSSHNPLAASCLRPVLLFEMFSGQDPYDGEDPIEVLKLVCDKAVNKRPSMPKNCPPQIESLMRDCVVANPAERPTFEELDKRVKRVDEKDVLWFGTPVQETALAPHKSTTMALLDMFPRHIAETLREGGKVEPEQHDMVSIYFSDVVGFSDLSDSLEPKMVADLLSRLHDKLDTLTRKHDIFKVETVGALVIEEEAADSSDWGRRA